MDRIRRKLATPLSRRWLLIVGGVVVFSFLLNLVRIISQMERHEQTPDTAPIMGAPAEDTKVTKLDAFEKAILDEANIMGDPTDPWEPNPWAPLRHWGLRVEGEKWLVMTSLHAGHCQDWLQLQQGAVTAFLMAEMLGRRFAMNVQYPCPLDRLVTSPYFSTDYLKGNKAAGRAAHISLLRDDPQSLAPVVSTLDWSRALRQDVVFVTVNQDLTWKLAQNTAFAQSSFLSKQPDIYFYAYALRELFRLLPPITKLVPPLAYDLHRRPIACAHVSLKKYGLSEKQIASTSAGSPLHSLWSRLQQLHSQGSAVFVASDERAMKEAARTLFSSDFLEVTDRRHESPTDSCVAMATDIAVQEMMQHCDVTIISTSDRAVMASYLKPYALGRLSCLSDSLEVVPCKREHLRFSNHPAEIDRDK